MGKRQRRRQRERGDRKQPNQAKTNHLAMRLLTHLAITQRDG